MRYSIRSERMLMKEIDYSVLFRWFVGLNLDESTLWILCWSQCVCSRVLRLTAP